MAKAGRLLHDGFLLMWDWFWIVCLSNLFWLVLLIPVITIPLAFAGLYSCAHGIVHGESVEWSSFFTGIKKHFSSSLRWTGANLLVLFVLGFYVWFFAEQGTTTSRLQTTLIGSCYVIAFLWGCINMFTFPFMLVQRRSSYLNALRNSAVLFLKWPGQALAFTLFNLIVIGLSLWLRFPWFILGASLPALMACLCVKDVVEQVNENVLPQS